jgi:hypothetical protein
MPSGHSQTWETLSIADVLDALDFYRDAVDPEPEPYLAVPGNSGPRWLIPAASRGAASVLRAWRPYSFAGQMKWLVIRIAARAGVAHFLPAVSRLTISRRSLHRWFEQCGVRSQGAEMVVLVGNPSPDRKLIVFLLDDARRIAAVLKIGLTPGGRLSVIREAEVLRKLEHYSWAPDVLSVHPDLGVAAQKYVDGAMPDRRFLPEYLDLLCCLPQSGGSLKLSVAAHSMAARLSPFPGEWRGTSPDLLNRCLSCLDRDTAIPTMLVHGDFAPWNIRRTAASGPVLVDWEWADFAWLPMHDLLHYQFSQDRLFGRKGGGYPAIRSSALCAQYCKRMDLDAKLLPQLAISYLLGQLESACKSGEPGATAYPLRQLAAVLDSLRAAGGEVKK